MRDHVIQVALIHVTILMFTCGVFFAFWIYFLICFEAISIYQLVGYYILFFICGINLCIVGPITFHILKVENGDPWCLRIMLFVYILLFLGSLLPTPFLLNVIAKEEETKSYIKDFYMVEGRPPFLMDYIQKSRHCCGYGSYKDYFRDPKVDIDVESPLPEPVPKSCCLQMSMGCEKSYTLIYKEGCLSSLNYTLKSLRVEHPYHGTGFFPVILLPLIIPLIHILLVCFLHDAFATIIGQRNRGEEKDESETDEETGGGGDVSQSQSVESSHHTHSRASLTSYDSEGTARSLSEDFSYEERKAEEERRHKKKAANDEKTKEANNGQKEKKQPFFKKQFQKFYGFMKDHTHKTSAKAEENFQKELASHSQYSDEPFEQDRESIHSREPKEAPAKPIQDAAKPKEAPHHIEVNSDKLITLHSNKGKEREKDNHDHNHRHHEDRQSHDHSRDSQRHHHHHHHQDPHHHHHHSEIDIPSATQHRMDELDKHLQQALRNLEIQQKQIAAPQPPQQAQVHVPVPIQQPHPRPAPPPQHHHHEGDFHRDHHGRPHHHHQEPHHYAGHHHREEFRDHHHHGGHHDHRHRHEHSGGNHHHHHHHDNHHHDHHRDHHRGHDLHNRHDHHHHDHHNHHHHGGHHHRH